MLLVCNRVGEAEGKRILAAEASGQAGGLSVDFLAEAMNQEHHRARRNERISMLLGVGSFCIGALGLWISYRRLSAESRP